MTIDQLSCFLMVAEHGSFTKAAEKLYISHSAVSKAIISLEDNLGVQLLIRSNRSVTLTPAGQLLLDRGAHLLALFQDLEERVRMMGKSAYGVLSLYVPYLYSSDLMPVYRLMKERFPYIHLDIRPCEPLNISAAIENRHIDAGVTFSFAVPEDNGDIGFMRLQKDYFYAVVPEGHPFAGRESVLTQEVLSQPLVCPPVLMTDAEPTVLSRIIRPFQETDCQAGNLEELVFQVALGKGVAILPGATFRGVYSNCGCRLVRLSDEREPFYMTVIWNKKKMSPALDCFLDVVMECTEEE